MARSPSRDARFIPPSPPWVKENKGARMLMVHMTKGELEGLDNLQGGSSIDPETGVREYSALASIIDIPEIRNLFQHGWEEIQTQGDLSPDFKKIYRTAQKEVLPYASTAEEKHNPLRTMERLGRKGDTKLALIPENLAHFFIRLMGRPQINPKTGLLEFGWFSELIRAVGTIGGAILGGPVGAGLGNMLGHAVTGSNTPVQAGLNTGMAVLGHNVAGPLGAGLGTTAVKAATGTPLKEVAMHGLKSAGLSAIATPLTGHHTGWGRAQAPVHAAKTASAGHAMASSPDMLSQTWGTLKDVGSMARDYAPLAMVGLAYAGSRHHHAQEKKRYNEERKAHRDAMNRLNKGHGLDQPWVHPSPSSRALNPKAMMRTPEEIAHGVFSEPFYMEAGRSRHASGGAVKSYTQGILLSGPGKGQDDLIKTSVPDGSYIIDASSTSMLGDGSTKAGGAVLKDLEEKIKRRISPSVRHVVASHVKRQAGQVPVWLSEGEYKFDPVTVTLLGQGSNARGAKLLKEMVIRLRKHKISRSDDLPPKAKHPLQYMSLKEGRHA